MVTPLLVSTTPTRSSTMIAEVELGVDAAEEEREFRYSPPVYQQRYDAVTSLVKRLRPKKVLPFIGEDAAAITSTLRCTLDRW